MGAVAVICALDQNAMSAHICALLPSGRRPRQTTIPLMGARLFTCTTHSSLKPAHSCLLAQIKRTQIQSAVHDCSPDLRKQGKFTNHFYTNNSLSFLSSLVVRWPDDTIPLSVDELPGTRCSGPSTERRLWPALYSPLAIRRPATWNIATENMTVWSAAPAESTLSVCVWNRSYRDVPWKKRVCY